MFFHSCKLYFLIRNLNASTEAGAGINFATCCKNMKEHNTDPGPKKPSRPGEDQKNDKQRPSEESSEDMEQFPDIHNPEEDEDFNDPDEQEFI